jgi:hypothetical protein
MDQGHYDLIFGPYNNVYIIGHMTVINIQDAVKYWGKGPFTKISALEQYISEITILQYSMYCMVRISKLKNGTKGHTQRTLLTLLWSYVYNVYIIGHI